MAIKYWVGNDPDAEVTDAQAQVLAGLGDVTATAAEVNAAADVSSRVVSIPDAATYTMLTSNSGKVHILPDLTVSCTITMPTAAAGLEYKFIGKGVVADAQNWVFNTGSDTNFYLGGLTELDTTGDTVILEVPDGNSNSIMTIVTPAPGTTIELFCDGTNWIISGVLQSETADAVLWADQ